MARPGILRHSRWDALLVGLSLVHGGVLIAAPSIPVVALGLWWNSNTISHNFIHLPFFKSAAANRAYTLYLTLLLGYPQSWWRDRHLAHHSGASAQITMNGGTTTELSLLLGMWIVMLAQAPRFFFMVYLPGIVLGLALCYVHGYFEHAHGTKSNYGILYNAPFFNDGYHVEHHSRPSEHWTKLPDHVVYGAKISRWPAVFRWIEVFNLELLERLALRCSILQRFLLKTHERAIREILPRLGCVRAVHVVGGGMFPRTAILLRRLMPEAEITVIDANVASIEAARPFLDANVKVVREFFDAAHASDADLTVIPLSFDGDREALYRNPPAANVLIHDWIWAKRAAFCKEGRIVSPWLLKRLNLIQR